jgi:hypothetical protein
LGLCKDHSPHKLGIVDSGIMTEAREQPHEHATVPVDRAFRESAMMSQPILELHNSLIDPLWDVWRGSLCDATLDQEANEPAHAAYVFGRED